VAKQSTSAGEPDLLTLVGDIVRQSEELITQQFSLLKTELREEVQKAGGAAAALAGGAGLLAAAGLLSTQALAHLLHRASGLPLWACYGVVAGALGAAGGGLLAAGLKKAAHLDLGAFPQTAEALKENLSWLKERVTTAPT
jgi:hypothetical protein